MRARGIAATMAGAPLAAVASLGLGGSATDAVTFSARPGIVDHNQPVTGFGTVTGARPDQLVAVQAKPCDQPNWRDIAETTARADGSWTVDFRPGISGEFRAASGGATSAATKLQQRPFMYFNLGRGKFSITIQAQRAFWHRKARVERFDPARGSWMTVKKVLLTTQMGSVGDPYIYTSSDAFTISSPKGTALRATLPSDQARPCYAAGSSPTVRR